MEEPQGSSPHGPSHAPLHDDPFRSERGTRGYPEPLSIHFLHNLMQRDNR